MSGEERVYTPVKTFWVTPLVTVVPIEVDYDLHAYHIYRNGDGVFLGTVDPYDLDAQEELVAELNDGGCPVADDWEDGKGNTCTIGGWLTEDDATEEDIADEVQTQVKNGTFDVTDFVRGDLDLMREYLDPAYEAMRTDLPEPGPDGLYDVDALARHLTFTRPSGENTLRRSGSSLCLVPYLGRRTVTVEERIELSKEASIMARQLMSILEDDDEPERIKAERSKELKHLLERIVALDERHVSGSVDETITVEPVTEEIGTTHND